ncbi:MAG: M1 family peptidase, partial [Chitinophagaceae bacterium]
MKKFLSTCILAGLFVLYTGAQSLSMPRNIKTAYLNETRSPDGKPGKRYWQNAARYHITLQAIPPDRKIECTEHITYFNNSPDTLRDVFVKIIQNIHRPGAVRDGDVDPSFLNPGTQIDSFCINNKSYQWQERLLNQTIQRIELPAPLSPRDSIQFFFKWHFLIAPAYGREGMTDSTTFFLAYFYPRISVYDDVYGWDWLNFSDLQEFYYDFSDYTLEVKVPANYLVWSTGTLQNLQDVLQPMYTQRLRQSINTDSVVHIVTKEDLDKRNITLQKSRNSWHWTATNVPDIALAISDHFVWDASSIIVDSNTKRRAEVHAVYNDTASDFKKAVEYGRYAVNWFSTHWPGLPYPYPCMTIMQGYADMEYPMLVNTEKMESPEMSRFLIDHEIAHTWFPFYVGINESRY